MKLVLNMDLDNDSFVGNKKKREISRLLEEVATKFRAMPVIRSGERIGMMDSNGNNVGHASIY